MPNAGMEICGSGIELAVGKYPGVNELMSESELEQPERGLHWYCRFWICFSNMSLQELLSKPFGPYIDSDILDEKCKSVQREMVSISSLWLDCKGSPIGFDETEAHPASHTVRTATHPIRFYGIVEIKSLSWLSPQGRKWLEIDVRKRDIEKRMHPEVNPVSKLTLEGLYGVREPGGRPAGAIFRTGKDEKLKLKVWVRGEKNMSVMFLNSHLLLTGLVFVSKDRTRHYEVLSMDVSILQLSRNFLARYQLLALMRDIVDTDDQHTPIENRSIDYFVAGYLKRYAFTEYHRHHRYISDQDDSDVDEDGRTRRPRHPPHIHRSEIVSLFAAQCELILGEQLSLRADKRIVCVDVWYAFCSRVRKERRDARNRGVRWGVRHGELNEEDFKEAIDLTQHRYSILGKDMAKLQKVLKAKKTMPVPVQRVKPPPRLAENTQSRTSTRHIQHKYDSDFSEPSTPSASDSESAPEDVDPELIAQIPRCFYFPPQLPSAGFTWQCPVRSCEYTIDMLELRPDNVINLPWSEEAFLRKKMWVSITEDRVTEGFYTMVSGHYHGHLSEKGIRLRHKSAVKATPEWIHPKRHQPWPPPKPEKNPRATLKDLEVKQEEEVVSPRRPRFQFAVCQIGGGIEEYLR